MKGFSLLVFVVVTVFSAIQASATDIEIVNLDSPGEGFRSNVSVAPVPGNRATTLGGQYLNVFKAAASIWEQRIDSPVKIEIDARLDPLRCSARSGTLGAAGPINGFIDFTNAPKTNTIYVVAQANSLAGIDLDPGNSDIVATFNSNLGTSGCLTGLSWWLGINSPAPAGTISLFDTVLHEIGHGLGFLSLVDPNGGRLANLNDAFMLNLFDVSQNKPWSVLSDGRRKRSARSNGGLVWSGANVAAGASVFTGGRTAGRLRMYAPRTFQQGSSVSHWDTAVSPNELMEPFATATSNACATALALKDMGWKTRNECVELFPKSSGSALSAINSLLLDDDSE